MSRRDSRFRMRADRVSDTGLCLSDPQEEGEGDKDDFQGSVSENTMFNGTRVQVRTGGFRGSSLHGLCLRKR